jgi:hypothetical protein
MFYDMRGAYLAIIVLILSALSLSSVTQEAAAHSPTFPGDNTSLANATLIDNPSKSWAVYTHLEEGTAQYYAVDLSAGDRLYLNLIVPTNEKGTDFIPDMAVLGPFTDRNGTLPSTVDVPSGYGWITVTSTVPDKATYESFSPSAFMNLATLDEPVPGNGRYYVVVFQDPEMAPVHGNYGLAVGYVESFTVPEFILLPFSLLNVYQWEGQFLLQVFIPMMAAFLIALLGLFWWRRDGLAQMGWSRRVAFVSGLLFFATATNTIIQTILAVSQAGIVAEVLVTLVFVVVPILLGWFALSIALAVGSEMGRRQRLSLFLIGLVGLFVWGGLIIGPVLAMIASVLPERRRVA